MTAVKNELQGQVDAQLLEQGVFAPLELLLNVGRLAYGDYETWRRGEIELLDEVWMGSPEKIRAELEQAVGYARVIGLVEQPQEFHVWPSGDAGRGAKPLRVSVDAQLSRFVSSRYVPAQTAPQLDLFFDNPVVALTTGLVRAISDRDRTETERLLNRLYTQAPTHSDLAAFDRLLAAVGQLGRAVEDPRQAMDFLLELAPTARRLLGSRSRDLLAPLWRQVADTLSSRVFLPADPDLHRSFALCQAQDWPGVAASVFEESGWWLHPTLCLRLAQSAFLRRRRVEALTAWCHLCWRAPEQTAEAVRKLRQPELDALWQRFLDSEEEASEADLAAEPPLTAADFPAWLLLSDPGLAQQLAEDLAPENTPAEENYRRVHRWIQNRRGDRPQEELALRKALQASHPVLFRMLKRSAEVGLRDSRVR